MHAPAKQVLAELRECQEKGLPPPFYSSDAKMADSVMDFLFASQVRDRLQARLRWCCSRLSLGLAS